MLEYSFSENTSCFLFLSLKSGAAWKYAVGTCKRVIIPANFVIMQMSLSKDKEIDEKGQREVILRKLHSAYMYPMLQPFETDVLNGDNSWDPLLSQSSEAWNIIFHWSHEFGEAFSFMTLQRHILRYAFCVHFYWNDEIWHHIRWHWDTYIIEKVVRMPLYTWFGMDWGKTPIPRHGECSCYVSATYTYYINWSILYYL